MSAVIASLDGTIDSIDSIDLSLGDLGSGVINLAELSYIVDIDVAKLQPADFTIELSSPEERIIAVIDGQDDYEMTSEDVLVIMGAKRGAKLLHRKEHNYFSVLREKLSWGDEH